MKEFYEALKMFLPREARVMYCQFRGDPNDDVPGKWRARVLNNPDNVDDQANVYVCVSAMMRNDIGEFRRRKENFCAGLCLMIDDLGTGIGAKQPLDTLDGLQPTALIETSPDSFQGVYMFDRAERVALKFEALIRAFVHTKLLSPQNSGMEGVNRVFRPPFGINGKAKYRNEGLPWKVQLAEWRPERRYSIEEIAKAFSLTLIQENRLRRCDNFLMQSKGDSIRAFVEVKRTLRESGMLRREEANRSGWIDVECPWREHHTDRADNGASIREPMEENGFVGAFRCHHGHCEGKGWRDLTDYLNEGVVDLLRDANNQAKSFDCYKWSAL